MQSSQYIHPTSMAGKGFTHGNGTVGIKLIFGDGADLAIFNSEEDYLEPRERLTGEDIVAALRQAANELANILRKEAQA